MKYRDRDFLIREFSKGKEISELAKELSISEGTLLKWSRRLNVESYRKTGKIVYNTKLMNKVDSKEKAYAIGFIMCDGTLSQDDKIRVRVALRDSKVVKFISGLFNTRVSVSETINLKQRRFPSSSTTISNKNIYDDVKRILGGRLKVERRMPIIKKELERFLVLGMFDADGCITYGRRKDRNRLWQKVSFTSQYDILIGLQNVLLKNNISTRLYKKKNEDCFVLETTNKKEIMKFLDYVYPNDEFIVLNRKYDKLQALRLELDENGES